MSLGGWLRGLEITAGLVAENYSGVRAGRLIQPELIDYFFDRLNTLNPRLKQTRPIQVIEKNLKQIRSMTARPADSPMTLEDVKLLRDLAREMNKAIVKGDEQ